MIVPKSTKVVDLFGSSVRLQVPKYQRAYAWGKNEILDMMTDLKASMDSGDQIFLGNFVFDVSQENVYKIVDGQQRITSLALLLLACRARAKELENTQLANSLQNRISFTDPTTGRMESERLLPSPSISEVFRHICDYDWDGEFPAKLGTRAVKRQSNRLKPLYDFMHSELATYDSSQLSMFLGTLFNAYVIQVDIEDTLDAFDIFERMNARGMSLNVADLVKNYLYANLLESQDIESQWDDITANADGTLQRMLKYFWVSRQGYILGKDLYRKLKLYGTAQGAERLTNELAVFSSYYAAARSNDEQKVAEWLRLEDCDDVAGNQEYLRRLVASLQGLNLFKITQHFPLIYSITKAYERSEKADPDTKVLLKLISNIEKYHFVNNQVCDRIGNEVEKLYAEWAQKFYSADDFRQSAREFNTLLMNQRAPEDEFVTRFVELDYSISLAETCYIFDRVNNYGLNASEWVKVYDPDPLLTKKNYNTEHFLSQNPEVQVPSEDMAMVDNIGNLFIISRHTNSHLNNRPPAEKIPFLQERGLQLRYVAKFINDFQAGDGQWGRTEIINRADSLAKFAYREVWSMAQI
ncbi:DUF262 domain-containing protein [soil metagenome]